MRSSREIGDTDTTMLTNLAYVKNIASDLKLIVRAVVEISRPVLVGGSAAHLIVRRSRQSLWRRVVAGV